MFQGKYKYQMKTNAGDKTIEIIVESYDQISAKNEVINIANNYNTNNGYLWNTNNLQLTSYEKDSNKGNANPVIPSNQNWAIESKLDEIKNTLSRIEQQGKVKF